MIYDISPKLSPRTAVWPGDTPLSREVLCDMSKGDNITLSTLRATVHLGAHADGANHYAKDAPGVDARRLEPYLGPCQLVDARAKPRTPITLPDLEGNIREKRVLIRTSTFPDFERFTEDFAALDPSLIETLGRRGVATIGIDTPSVDLFDSKDLPAHAAFHRNAMAILENLDLKNVPAGTYELIALPLPLEGFDASPVRAVLRTMDHRPD